MKLFLMTALMVSAVFANYTSYKGETYKAEMLFKCESDFLKMTQRMESVEGFKVIDGGCTPMMEAKFYKLQFNYLHPFTKRLDTDKVSISNDKECEKINSTIENKISQAGNVYVHSYCERNELKISQIDLTYSLMRGMNKLGKFSTLNMCQSFLKTLENKASKSKAFVITSDCKKQSNYNSDVTYYSPIANILANHKLELQVIKGRAVNTLSNCEIANEDTRRNFSIAGVNLVHSYCDDSNNTFQEYMIYLKPDLPYYIDEYRAIPATSINSCIDSLERIKSALLSVDKKILNSYCKEIRENLFKPMVTYLKKI